MPTKRFNRGTINHVATEYGKTEMGAPLKVYLPQNVNAIDILIMAGIHGDEPQGTVLLSEALRNLLQSELQNAVILCANPDGMAMGTRANSNGVDLNRNFPSKNWKPDPVYYKNTKGEQQDIELSPGNSPVSENETKYLVKLMEKLNPNYLIGIHAALACIEDPEFSSLSKWISDKSNLPLVENVGYDTPGSLGSWAADNKITIITYELPSESLMEIKNKHLSLILDIITKNYKK
jgi:protein MpaA